MSALIISAAEILNIIWEANIRPGGTASVRLKKAGMPFPPIFYREAFTAMKKQLKTAIVGSPEENRIIK